MPQFVNFMSRAAVFAGETGEAAGSVLRSVVTADMMNGVMNEVIGLLPVCIPVMVTFIGLRKGISFMQSILHSA